MTESATRTEIIAAEPTESLAAVFDRKPPTDAEVPELWHWLYLFDRRPESELGPDGHPTSGIPAPPGPGRRRMFAGGRVTTLRRLSIGESATRESRVVNTVDKQGGSGLLTFVTVRHEISQDGTTAIVDEQDIVYRAQGTTSLPGDRPTAQAVPERSDQLELDVDERLLFRFSALTYNAHRIHYDLGWAQHEGYDGLVVHGPLQAILMGEVVRRADVSLVGKQFAYRLVGPMVGAQVVTAVAAESGVTSGAEVYAADGRCTATATLTPLDRT